MIKVFTRPHDTRGKTVGVSCDVHAHLNQSSWVAAVDSGPEPGEHDALRRDCNNLSSMADRLNKQTQARMLATDTNQLYFSDVQP